MVTLTWPDPSLVRPDAGIALRPWRRDDAAALAEAWEDPEILRWTAVPDAHRPADVRLWIEGTERRRAAGVALDLVIADKATDQVRGEVGLTVTDRGRRWAEIGYWSRAAWRGSGSTICAVRLFTDWALAPPLALTQLYARVDRDNAGSIAVLRRVGYVARGTVDDGRHLWARQSAGTVPV